MLMWFTGSGLDYKLCFSVANLNKKSQNAESANAIEYFQDSVFTFYLSCYNHFSIGTPWQGFLKLRSEKNKSQIY